MAIAMPMCAREKFDSWLDSASEKELDQGISLYQQAASQILVLLESKRRARSEDTQDTERLIRRMQARASAIAARRAQLLF